MRKTILSILVGLIISIATQAQSTTPQKKMTAPRKMVVPSYLQPSSSTSPWSGNSFKHEVDLNFSQGYFRTYTVAGKSISDLNIFASYSYDFGHSYQIGGDAGIQSVDSTTKLTAVGTGTYNLDSDYANSIFFKAGLGLLPITKVSPTGIDNKSDIGFYVAAGKRFKLWDHVNYKPAVVISKISDQDVQFTVQFLNVSLNFSSF